MRNKGQPGVSPAVGALHPEMPEGGPGDASASAPVVGALHPEMPEGGQAVPWQEQGRGTGHERQQAQGGSVPALGSGCAEETGGGLGPPAPGGCDRRLGTNQVGPALSLHGGVTAPHSAPETVHRPGPCLPGNLGSTEEQPHSSTPRTSCRLSPRKPTTPRAVAAGGKGPVRADAVPAQHIAPYLTVRPTHGGLGPLSEGRQALRADSRRYNRKGAGSPPFQGQQSQWGKKRGIPFPSEHCGAGDQSTSGGPCVRSSFTPTLNPQGTCKAAEGSRRRRLPEPVRPLCSVLLSLTRGSAGTQRPLRGLPAAGPSPQGGRLLTPSASSWCPCHSHRPRRGAACLGGPPEDGAAFKGDAEATGRA